MTGDPAVSYSAAAAEHSASSSAHASARAGPRRDMATGAGSGTVLHGARGASSLPFSAFGALQAEQRLSSTQLGAARGAGVCRAKRCGVLSAQPACIATPASVRPSPLLRFRCVSLQKG